MTQQHSYRHIGPETLGSSSSRLHSRPDLVSWDVSGYFRVQTPEAAEPQNWHKTTAET